MRNFITPKATPLFCLLACTALEMSSRQFLLAQAPSTAPTSAPAIGPIKVDFSGQVWAAKPAAPDAKLVPQHARVVDYGDDFCHYRMDQWLLVGKVTGEPADLQGAGRKSDIITGVPFSLTEPLLGFNKGVWHPRCDWEATNMVIYGGRTQYILGYNKATLIEGGGPNMDHSAGADDLNFMLDSPTGKEKLRSYGLWLWKKDDFREGGGKYRVSFDATSRIGLHCPRHWTHQQIGGRFVAADGAQFYISETVFRGASGTSHWIKPAETKWAKYNPTAPWDIAFDPKKATFEPHQFADVRWVGYYLGVDEYTSFAINSGVKLGAFECEAVVEKPVRPSEALAMVEVPAAQATVAGQKIAVGPFYMSNCPIPYTFYQKIYRWAFSDCYVDTPGYIFDRAGDLGSMRLLPTDGKPLTHSPDEPATGMTWLDALAWCNALSESEGKTPVYYADPEFKEVFRIARERRFKPEELAKWVPQVYVKWDADGYRLPTAAEWLAACQTGGSNPQPPTPTSNSTHPVGSTPPDKLGLYDLTGNVWQWVWDYGDIYNLKADGFIARHTVLGGDFTGQEPVVSGDPFRGSFYIGLRVVRNVPGKPPAKSAVKLDFKAGADLAGKSLGVPSWTFTQGEKKPGGLAEPGKAPVLDLVQIKEGKFNRQVNDGPVETFVSAFQMARTEIPFDKWERVRQWALAHGYQFSYDGDMGSMYHQSQRNPHSTDEPATRMSWWDMLAWCNALSEMEGRKPCYYQDADFKDVYRISPPVQKWQVTCYGDRDKAIRDRFIKTPTAAGPKDLPIHIDWSADGYRLPTRAEWQYACQAGETGASFWGDPASYWAQENSGERTMPVARTKPNAWGLYDLVGNVMEWNWSTRADDPDITRNPKCSSYGREPLLLGGSFLFPAKSSFFGIEANETTHPHLAYPEIGFRVVRCEKNTHPADGNEPQPEKIYVETTGQPAPPALQNATFRGNQARTGLWESKGVKTLQGVKWKFKTEGPVQSSPVVVDGVLYVGSGDKNVYAIEVKTGKEKWKFETRGPVRCAPTVVEGVVYIGSDDGRLYALKADTGEVLWNTPAGKPVLGAPAVGYSAVFVDIPGYGKGLMAFDQKTGKLLARYSKTAGIWATDTMHSPALVDGALIHRAAVDVRRGTILPTEVQIGQATPVEGTFAVRDGVLYMGLPNTLVATNYKTGKQQWFTFIQDLKSAGGELQGRNQHRVKAATACAGGQVYLASLDGNLYAFDAQDGKLKWAFKTGGEIWSAPALTPDGVVYVGSRDKKVYAVNVQTGDKLWEFPTAGPVDSSPCVSEGVLYVGSDDGNVYALEGAP